jgi:hypothetical protein
VSDEADHKDAERGRMAQQVLENAVYAESYGLIESELTRVWRESRDPAEREQIHMLLRMLDKVKNVMESTMRRGEIAAAEIRRKQTLAERAAGVFKRQ